ncbi:MAG: cell division protein FtsZ, partial [Longicatena sp.]
ETVREAANSDVNIIFGAIKNENLTDEVIVTVIATGFDTPEEEEEVIPTVAPKATFNQAKQQQTTTSSIPQFQEVEDNDSEGIPSFFIKR